MADLSEKQLFKKQFSAQFSAIEVPPPLEQVDPEALAASIKGNAAKQVILDVRNVDEFEKGHVAGAKNIPHSEFDAEKYVEEVKKLRAENSDLTVVFVSLQSPDIDEAAALSFVRAWDDAGDGAATSFVRILLGGTFYWLQLFKDDSALSEAVDKAYWEPILEKHTASSS